MTPSAIVTATEVELVPDHTRVITRFFVPGHEDVGPGDSRAAPVIERILRLGEEDVEAALRDVDERFSDRHEALHQTFSEHAAMVTSRIDPDVSLSKARELLLGASFTHEYAIEGAALCNPSAVDACCVSAAHSKEGAYQTCVHSPASPSSASRLSC